MKVTQTVPKANPINRQGQNQGQEAVAEKLGGSSMSRLLTPEEVAKQFRLAVSTIYHLVHRGELPAIKIGRSVRFDEQRILSILKGSEKKSLKKAA